MRHQKKGRKLGRKTGPRTALMKNLADSLILYEKIKTTEAKAKELRPYVERLLTSAKKNTLVARRTLISKLKTENAVKKTLEVYGPKYKDRKGGYTRIVKLEPRKGDGAQMAQIEFV
ncbi:50S ribosomal protein L17 [Patescibacteria group bacterium]|nr:50S ribosomal protein L17 [Patescibacteria group bacterium]MBU4512920.1 50S ribosomal protein L17 [Patescibacteria group bacterium]